MLGCRGSGGKVLGGGLSGFPVIREGLSDPFGGVGADAVEDVRRQVNGAIWSRLQVVMKW